MADMLIGYRNYADADGVVFTGGSWTASLSNLADPIVSNKARSNGLTLANTQFRVDLGASKSLVLAAITHTNMSASALYKITWYSDAFTTAVGNTGWLAIPGYPDEDPDFKGVSIFHVFAEATSARYWKIELDDEDNVDTYVEVGRLFMPEELGMSRDPDVVVPDILEPNTQKSSALGGTVFANRRKPLLKLSFGYSNLDAADAPKIRKLRKYCNLNKQIVVIPDPDDEDNFNERNFVGTLNALPRITLLSLETIAGDGFEIIEVV